MRAMVLIFLKAGAGLQDILRWFFPKSCDYDKHPVGLRFEFLCNCTLVFICGGFVSTWAVVWLCVVCTAHIKFLLCNTCVPCGDKNRLHITCGVLMYYISCLLHSLGAILFG